MAAETACGGTARLTSSVVELALRRVMVVVAVVVVVFVVVVVVVSVCITVCATVCQRDCGPLVCL